MSQCFVIVFHSYVFSIIFLTTNFFEITSFATKFYLKLYAPKWFKNLTERFTPNLIYLVVKKLCFNNKVYNIILKISVSTRKISILTVFGKCYIHCVDSYEVFSCLNKGTVCSSFLLNPSENFRYTQTHAANYIFTSFIL